MDRDRHSALNTHVQFLMYQCGVDECRNRGEIKKIIIITMVIIKKKNSNNSFIANWFTRTKKRINGRREK